MVVEAFTDHTNAVDHRIKFTHEDIGDNILAFLDCTVHTETDKLIFDSRYHPQNRLGIIGTLNHRA